MFFVTGPCETRTLYKSKNVHQEGCFCHQEGQVELEGQAELDGQAEFDGQVELEGQAAFDEPNRS